MELKDIKFDHKNYRIHSEENKALIRKAIKETGLGRSVVIDSDNELIAGNGVVSQLPEGTKVQVVETDGSTLVVVKRTDLKRGDKKRKQLAAYDNSASNNVDWDYDNLQGDFDLEELEAMGIDLDLGDDGKKEVDIENKEVKIIFNYRDSSEIIEKFIEEMRQKYPELLFEVEISD